MSESPSVSDLSSDVVPKEISALISDGRLDEAWVQGAGINDHGLKIYSRIAQTLSAASWLSSNASDLEVRDRAGSILKAIATIDARWVKHARPRALLKESIPHTLEDLNRLFVSSLNLQGFYHPIDLPGVDSEIAVPRPNTRSNLTDYHEREWDLVNRLVTNLFHTGIAGRTVLDLGPADGFFTLKCARAGASVLAYDRHALMVARTAVFSVLAGVSDRVTVRLLSVDRIDPNVWSSGPDTCDLILALGVIYHFDDLVGDLARIVGLRVPVVFEFPSTGADNGDRYDPAARSDNRPISLRWFLEWLDGQGFDATVEPDWGRYNNDLTDGDTRYNMVLAVPR